MEKYNEKIADNPKVELIHVSQDFESPAAEKWAVDAKFPWLTVLAENYKASGMRKYYTEAIVPFYTMVDGEGKEVAQGPDAIFEKIESLK